MRLHKPKARILSFILAAVTALSLFSGSGDLTTAYAASGGMLGDSQIKITVDRSGNTSHHYGSGGGWSTREQHVAFTDDNGKSFKTVSFCLQPTYPGVSDGGFTAYLIKDNAENMGTRALLWYSSYADSKSHSYSDGASTSNDYYDSSSKYAKYAFSTVRSKYGKALSGWSDYAVIHVVLSYMYYQYAQSTSGDSGWMRGISSSEQAAIRAIGDYYHKSVQDKGVPEGFYHYRYRCGDAGQNASFGLLATNGYLTAHKGFKSGATPKAGAIFTVYAKYSKGKATGKIATITCSTKSGDVYVAGKASDISISDGYKKVAKAVQSSTGEYVIQLPCGTYYIQETKAPEGYAKDTSVYKAVVTSKTGNKSTTYSIKYASPDTPYTYSTESAGTVTRDDATVKARALVIKDTKNFTNTPKYNPATLYVFKYDESNGDDPQGDAEGFTQGTKFSVNYTYSYTTSGITGYEDRDGDNIKETPVYGTVTKYGTDTATLSITDYGTVSGTTGWYGYKNVDKGLTNFKITAINSVTETGASAGYKVSAGAVSKISANIASYSNKTKTGNISVAKQDALSGSAQGDASFANITFEVTNLSDETIYYNGKAYEQDDVVGTLQTGQTISGLPYGTYGVEEVATNDSMRLTDGETKIVECHEDGKTYTVTFSDDVVRGGLQIVKYDTDYNTTAARASSEAQGDATLEGVTFTIKNSSGQTVYVADESDSGIKLASKSGAKTYEGVTYYAFGAGATIGTITTSWDPAFTYKDKNGGTYTGAYVAMTDAFALPYGTYTVQETSANDGYNRTSTNTYTIQVHNDYTFETIYDTTSTTGGSFSGVDVDTVKRGGVKVVKVDEERTNTGEGKNFSQGDVDLSGITYEIVNYSSAADGGSKAEVYVNSVWYSTHSEDTTGNGSVVETIETKWDGTNYSATSGTVLPYGTYQIYEIPYKYVVYNTDGSVKDEYIATTSLSSGAVTNYVNSSGTKLFATDRTNSQTFAEFISGATYTVDTEAYTIKVYSNDGQLYTDETVYTFEIREQGKIVTDFKEVASFDDELLSAYEEKNGELTPVNSEYIEYETVYEGATISVELDGGAGDNYNYTATINGTTYQLTETTVDGVSALKVGDTGYYLVSDESGTLYYLTTGAVDKDATIAASGYQAYVDGELVSLTAVSGKAYSYTATVDGQTWYFYADGSDAGTYTVTTNASSASDGDIIYSGVVFYATEVDGETVYLELDANGYYYTTGSAESVQAPYNGDTVYGLVNGELVELVYDTVSGTTGWYYQSSNAAGASLEDDDTENDDVDVDDTDADDNNGADDTNIDSDTDNADNAADDDSSADTDSENDASGGEQDNLSVEVDETDETTDGTLTGSAMSYSKSTVEAIKTSSNGTDIISGEGGDDLSVENDESDESDAEGTDADTTDNTLQSNVNAGISLADYEEGGSGDTTSVLYTGTLYGVFEVEITDEEGNVTDTEEYVKELTDAGNGSTTYEDTSSSENKTYVDADDVSYIGYVGTEKTELTKSGSTYTYKGKSEGVAVEYTDEYKASVNGKAVSVTASSENENVVGGTFTWIGTSGSVTYYFYDNGDDTYTVLTNESGSGISINRDPIYTLKLSDGTTREVEEVEGKSYSYTYKENGTTYYVFFATAGSEDGAATYNVCKTNVEKVYDKNYTDTAYMTFVNYVARGGITLVKRDTDRVDTVYDSDTEAVAEGVEKAQGDDTLAGVTFAIINASSNKADGNAAVYVGYDKNGTPCSIYNASTKKWVATGGLVGYITTKWDADYTYVDKDGNTVTGAYVASTAADACDTEDYTLPYGTYKVFEVASYTYINGVKTAVTYTWNGSKMVYKLADGTAVTTQLYANDGTLLTDESVYTYKIRYDGVIYASATDKSLDYSESSGWVGTGTSGSQKYSSTYADEKTTLFEGTQDTVNFVNDVARGGVEVVKLDTERYDTDTGETWSQGDGTLEGVTYVIKNVSSAADGGSNAYVCIYYDKNGNVIDAEDYSEADGDHYRWVSTNGGVAAHISTFWDAKYSYVDKDGNTITGAYVATTDTDGDGYDDTEGALPYGTYTIQEVVYKYVVYDSTHDAVDEFVLVTDKYGDITGYTNGTKTVEADGTTKLTVSDLGYGEGYSVVLYANDSSLYTDETVYTFEIREDGKIVTDYTSLTLDTELKEASTATTYGNYTDTAYMTFVNDVVRGDVLIYKYDTETNVSSALGGDGITETTENGTALEGIVFTIYNISECDDGSDSDAAIYAGDGKWYATGDVVTTITTEWSDEYNAYVATTGTDGFLPYGTYAIVENPSDQLNDVYRANSSYLLGTDATIFEIRYDGEIVTCGNYWDDDYYYDTASGATSKDTASHTPYVLYEGDTALDIIYMAYENRSNVLLATKAGGDTYQCLEGTIIYGYDKTFSVTSSTGYTYTNKDGKTVTLNADEISIVPIGGTGVSFDADDILYARKYGANTKSDLLNLLAAKNANEQVRAADDNYNTLATAVALDNDDPDTRDNVNSLIFHDQVVRNDFEFSKVDKNGNGLETIWVLTNNSTGEQHVLVTDENGVYDSSKIKHSTNTNANDALLDDCLEAIENMSDLTLDGGWKKYVNNDDFDYQSGTWFGLTEADVNGTTVMADVDDALSALPYGRYTLQEVPSTSNSGYGMVSYVFMIDTDSTMTEIEDLGTFVNDDTPEMQTILMSTEDDELLGNKTVRGEVVTLVDTIEYARLTAGMNYIFKTQLVNSGNGDILWEGWSEPFTAQDEDSTQPYYYQNGTAKVYLKNVDLSEYTGTSVTAYEYLYTYTGEMYPEKEYDGADLHIGTTLVDSTDSNHVVEAGEETTLTDTVKYYNLDKGTTYTIVGVLMDKATGEPLTTTETVETTEEDGTVTTTTITKNILARASFTAEETSGSADITFTLDTSSLEGKQLVAYEYLFTGDVYPETSTDTTAETLPGTIGEVNTDDATASHEDIGDKYQTVEVVKTDDHGADELVDEHVEIDDEDQTVDVVGIGTTLVDSETGTHDSQADKDVILIDTVEYKGLEPGATYTLYGVLMDKSTGKKFVDYDKQNPTAIKTFVPKDSSGTVEVVFEFNATGKENVTVVAYEYLFEGAKKDVDVNNDTPIDTHEDLGDADQTVHFPHIGTTLLDGQTAAHVANADGTVTLNDTIAYTNLTVGEIYSVKGVLMDKATGKEMKDAKGNTITASTNFTCKSTNGSITLPFTFDATGLEGSTVVAYEYLMASAEVDEDMIVAEHEDIDDEGQTVYVPEIGTTLADEDGYHETLGREDMVFTDTVEYTNLLPGTEYTIYGILMDKATGKPIKDDNDNYIFARKFFTPKESSGTVKVKFDFDGYEFDDGALTGVTVVAYEYLFVGDVRTGYKNAETDDKLVASHTDIDDEAQSIIIPAIHTTLADVAGNHETGTGEGVSLIDRVYFENLVVGEDYTISGALHYAKGTGSKAKDQGVLEDSTGTAYTASVSFKATKSSGYIDIEFVVDTSDLNGYTIVAFEELSDSGTVIATHEDITDEDQSVTVDKNVSVATSAKPQTGLGTMLPILFAIMAGCGVLAAYVLKRKKVSE